VATAAAGLATGFGQLFVARAAVGIGEATYAPAASSLISDRFKPAQRARAMGGFQLGMVLGGAVGLIAGGVVGQQWGWRAAFLLVGLPGFVLALLVLFVYEAERPRAPSASRTLSLPAGAPYSVSAVVWIVCAGIMTTFFTGALSIWGAEFVLRVLYAGEKAHMSRVMSFFGPIVLFGSVIGTVAGSFLADRLEAWRPGNGRLLTVAISVFGAMPCVVVALSSHHAWVIYTMLFFGSTFAVFYAGPIIAALHDVVPPELRATVTGGYFFAIHLLGDSVSPWLVGKIDDLTHSLRIGLLVAAGALVLAGVSAILALPGARRVAQLKAGAVEE
jgi:MFS family permease